MSSLTKGLEQERKSAIVGKGCVVVGYANPVSKRGCSGVNWGRAASLVAGPAPCSVASDPSILTSRSEDREYAVSKHLGLNHNSYSRGRRSSANIYVDALG